MTNTRILIVEDDPEQSALFEKIMLLSGYEVAVVHDAESARKLLCNQSFALTLIDCTLPGMTGSELVAALRAQNLPCKLVLMDVNDNLRRRARDAGADGWVDKLSGLKGMAQVVGDLVRDHHPDP